MGNLRRCLHFGAYHGWILLLKLLGYALNGIAIRIIWRMAMVEAFGFPDIRLMSALILGALARALTDHYVPRSREERRNHLVYTLYSPLMAIVSAFVVYGCKYRPYLVAICLLCLGAVGSRWIAYAESAAARWVRNTFGAKHRYQIAMKLLAYALSGAAVRVLWYLMTREVFVLREMKLLDGVLLSILVGVFLDRYIPRDRHEQWHQLVYTVEMPALAILVGLSAHLVMTRLPALDW